MKELDIDGECVIRSTGGYVTYGNIMGGLGLMKAFGDELSKVGKLEKSTRSS